MKTRATVIVRVEKQYQNTCTKNITRGLITSFHLIFLVGQIHFKHILNRHTHSLQTSILKALIFSPHVEAHQFTKMPV